MFVPWKFSIQSACKKIGPKSCTCLSFEHNTSLPCTLPKVGIMILSGSLIQQSFSSCPATKWIWSLSKQLIIIIASMWSASNVISQQCHALRGQERTESQVDQNVQGVLVGCSGLKCAPPHTYKLQDCGPMFAIALVCLIHKVSLRTFDSSIVMAKIVVKKVAHRHIKKILKKPAFDYGT